MRIRDWCLRIRDFTLEAEGMVLRAISVMFVKVEGMRSLIGRFAKWTTLLPNLPAIFVVLQALIFAVR